MAIKVADTLERLDNTLDEVDSLITELPLTKETKVKLTSMVYELWMDVEEELAK
jgi:site-specific recombinase